MGAVNVTPFGKEIRKLRIDANEVLMNMADRLGITAAYLSSIENGKRDIPEDFIEKIVREQSLSDKQKKTLALAKAETQNKVILQMPENIKENQELYETAVLFARDLSKLNPKQLQKVQEILSSVQEEE